MAKPHPKNERMKRKYLQWLETAKGASVKTADRAAASIAAFESSTNGKGFEAFHIEQAVKFKRDLDSSLNPATKKPLAKATVRSRLMDVKAFFKWLADQQGYKSRISHSDCEYFNQTSNDTRIATARREQPFPTLEQVHYAIACARHQTAVEKRDRALVAFTLLTGMRDGAIASMPIGKVDPDTGEVFQDARDVRTKFAKTVKTFFFPVGGEARKVVVEWIAFLREGLLFGDSDPLFPKTDVGRSEEGVFAALGLQRAYWYDASAVRRIFRERFEAAGLPYFHPHSIRKTLMQVAFKMRLHPEALKAWSQNLSHDNLATSLNSYGHVSDWRTAEIMQELAAQSKVDFQGVDLPTEVLAWLKTMVECQ